MAPPGWANPKQSEFLSGKRSLFFHAKANKKEFPNFWNGLFSDWLVLFPLVKELWPDEDLDPNTLDGKRAQEYADALTALQKRLKAWFFWHCNPRSRGSNDKIPAKEWRKIFTKQGRMKKDYEVYAKHHPERMAEHHDAHCEQEGLKGRKKVTAWHKHAKELYAGASVFEREAVEKQLDDEAAAIAAAGDWDESKEASPEEYQRYLDMLPGILKAAIEPAVRKAGVMAVVTYVGPVPRDGGMIGSTTLQFGDEAETPVFAKSWSDHGSVFVEKLASFSRLHVFTPDVCARRALNTQRAEEAKEAVETASLATSQETPGPSSAIPTAPPPTNNNTGSSAFNTGGQPSFPTTPALASASTLTSTSPVPSDSDPKPSTSSHVQLDLPDESQSSSWEAPLRRTSPTQDEEWSNKSGQNWNFNNLDISSAPWVDPEALAAVERLERSITPYSDDHDLYGLSGDTSSDDIHSSPEDYQPQIRLNTQPTPNPYLLHPVYPQHTNSTPQNPRPHDPQSQCFAPQSSASCAKTPYLLHPVYPPTQSGSSASETHPGLTPSPNSFNYTLSGSSQSGGSCHGSSNSFPNFTSSPHSFEPSGAFPRSIQHAHPNPPSQHIPIHSAGSVLPLPQASPAQQIPIPPAGTAQPPAPIAPVRALSPPMGALSPHDGNRPQPANQVALNVDGQGKENHPPSSTTSQSPEPHPSPPIHEDPNHSAQAENDNTARRSTRGTIPSTRLERLNEIGTNPSRPSKPPLDPAMPNPWFDSVVAFFESPGPDLGATWSEVVRKWRVFENSLGYGRSKTGASYTKGLPSKGRPTEWSKIKMLSGVRYYEKLPFVSDPAEFGLATAKWWKSMQDPIRCGVDESPLPLSIYTNPSNSATDLWANVRRAGPNGLVSILILVFWWGRLAANQTDKYREDSRPQWNLVLEDINKCLDALLFSMQPSSTALKRGPEETEDDTQPPEKRVRAE